MDAVIQWSKLAEAPPSTTMNLPPHEMGRHPYLVGTCGTL